MHAVTPPAVAPVGTRIRAYLGTELVADSRAVMLLRESPLKLFYCFPRMDVRDGVLDPASERSDTTSLGARATYAVQAGATRANEAAFVYTEPDGAAKELGSYVGFAFDKLDRWLEEEDELIGHPRDPWTRIDVRRSARHVVVRSGSAVVIDTRKPRLLLETGLRLRYYVPHDDVDWRYFPPSARTSVCPYKGRARYWSITMDGGERQDVVWSYPDPLQDGEPIRDHVGVYHEKLDVEVDGTRLEEEAFYFTK